MAWRRLPGEALRRDLARQGLRSFEVAPSKIRVLSAPGEFYEELLGLCGGAVSRVSLSALYWGTGDLEVGLAALITLCIYVCNVLPGYRQGLAVTLNSTFAYIK